YPFCSYSFFALILFAVVSVNDLCQNNVHEREEERHKKKKRGEWTKIKRAGLNMIHCFACGKTGCDGWSVWYLSLPSSSVIGRLG
uniref:Uncharacterized protein n=1 Tax=Stegastes partitus TaxID=144197 RepID=A0A3B5BIN1_9TELE